MKNIFLLAIFLFLFFSCKKEKKQSDPVVASTHPSILTHVPLDSGSYWIYKYVNIDTLGNETPNGSDTIRITGDSIINGKLYARFKGEIYYNCPSCTFFRRDSLGYTVDQNGYIVFSETNFTDTLRVINYLPNSIAYLKMMHHDSLVTVPAGTFTTSDFECITYYGVTYPWSNPRNVHSIYAIGVGLIKARTYFTQSPDYIETRLVAYHIGH